MYPDKIFNAKSVTRLINIKCYVLSNNNLDAR